MRRPISIVLVVVMVMIGCSDEGGRAISPEAAGVDVSAEGRCDPLVPEQCLLPFPSDHFRVGGRLRFDRASMPANIDGVHIDPADWRGSDGFSPGSPVIAEIPGVDATRSKLPSLTDLRQSVAPRSPIVIVDQDSGRRLAFWAEMDSLADPGTQPTIMVHPAVNWPEGHRITVGMRGLVDGAGAKIAASPAFVAYRDGQRLTDQAFEARRDSMDRTFADLEAVGVDRQDLQLAWSFTVGTGSNIAGRMLAMRRDAFKHLNHESPKFVVDSATDHPDPRVFRQVDGHFDVPLYLSGKGEPGSRLVLDSHGRPRRQEGTFRADFRCTIPNSAVVDGSPTPSRMALYGHGLLGSRDEVGSDMVRDMSQRFNIVYCATDFYGMAEEDVLNAAAALHDMSKFGSLPDRIQQGLLAFLFLGRAMKHDDGFSSDPAFQVGGNPIPTGDLFYDGNSQGAILGGALCAVAEDFSRCVLGEAGMNYALLLDRSVDFDEYLQLAFKPAYPTRSDRVLAISLASILWDRGETNGYAQHLTKDPYPDTATKTVLLLGAVGDHQVTEYSLRVEARTIGVPARTPVAASGRTVEVDPAWGLKPLGKDPWRTSAYVLSDTGSPASPLANEPPREGHDPHDDTPNIPEIQDLKDRFMHRDGTVVDVCEPASPCTFPVPAANAD